MHRPRASAAADLAARFAAFVLERHPFGAAAAIAAFDRSGGPDAHSAPEIEKVRASIAGELASRMRALAPRDVDETTPGVPGERRYAQAVKELTDACDGFLRRAAIRASLTPAERLEILRGMIMTRATDNRLKTFFTSGEVRFRDAPFQGKGFRSLGQEAIYAAGVRLRRGAAYPVDGRWRGDVVARVIRDLGVAIAMRPEPETVRAGLSAQMAKAGPPMGGRDLHFGDLEHGILPAAAPLAIGTLTIAGMAMAFAREG